MLDGLIEIIGAIGGAYLLMKTTIEIQSLKTNNRQSDYDFTKRLLEDIKVFKREQGSLLCEDKDRRLFLVEKGIRSLTGKVMGLKEFEYLLSQKNPSISIIRRNSSSSFIRWHDDVQGYDWIGIYKKSWSRRFGSGVLWFGYFVTVLPVILAFLAVGSDMFKSLQVTFAYGVLIALGILCIVKSEDLKTAIKFMDEHSQSPGQLDSSNNQLNSDAAGGAR